MIQGSGNIRLASGGELPGAEQNGGFLWVGRQVTFYKATSIGVTFPTSTCMEVALEQVLVEERAGPAKAACP